VPTVEAVEALLYSLTQIPPHFWIITFILIALQATVLLELEILETELTAKT
jgi:hypothetical protein